MTNKIQGIEKDFFQLARIALSGRPQDIQALLYRVVKKDKGQSPEFSQMLSELLRKAPTRSSPLRKTTERAMPVDIDSRFQLLRIEEDPVLNHEPVYSPDTQSALDRIVLERKNTDKLLEAKAPESPGSPIEPANLASASDLVDVLAKSADAFRRNRVTNASSLRVIPSIPTPLPWLPRTVAEYSTCWRLYPSVSAFDTLLDTVSAERDIADKPEYALFIAFEILMALPP